MNKISKNLISSILILSLCFVLLDTIHVRAEGETGGDNTITTLAAPRTLSVEFMGNDLRPSETSVSSGSFSSISTNPQENVFWISVAVTGVEDLSIFQNGIYSFEVAFDYDPTFVEPYSHPSVTDKEQDWNDNIKQGNMWSMASQQGVPTYRESNWWRGTLYTVYSSRESDINVSNRREDQALAITRKNNGWKTCSALIVSNSTFGASAARFYGITSSDKQYLIKLPFRLLKVPASTDADQNPTVISLVRGTEELNIGSDSTGTTPHSEWYPAGYQGAPTDEENMETLFNFGGDIKLFASTTASAISNIIPTKPGDQQTGTPDVTYTLSHDTTEQQEGFIATVNTYYVTVPNDVDSIRLDITSSSQPTAYLNTAANTLTVTPTGSAYQTNVFNLDELDKTVQADGYNNKVVVTAGGKLYEVYIRRLLKPKIELEPGNGPYGLIERMGSTKYTAAADLWDSTKIADAKTQFNKGNKFVKNYTPTGQKTYLFSPKAWGMANNNDPDINNPEKNMDRNVNAIFINFKVLFTDPGFTATDAYGDAVDPTQITRTITVDRMPSKNTTSMRDTKVTQDTITLTNKIEKYPFTELNTGKTIRPNIYDMEYSFTDSTTGDEAKITRKVIILATLGDADMSGILNTGDASTTTSYVKGVSNPIKNVNTTTANIYLYRIVDADRSGIVNTGDASTITSIVKGVSKPKTFYE